MTRALVLGAICAAAPALIPLFGCKEKEKDLCVGGLDDATCTVANDGLFVCDECGESYYCSGYANASWSHWAGSYIPCECVCPDGGILNTSNEGGTCYRQVGEHNDEDTGPYRETCDDPRWDE